MILAISNLQLVITRSSHQSCSVRKSVSQISQNSQKHLCQSFSFNKVAGVSPAILLKNDSGTDVSSEFCEISKNNFFTEHIWATASE